jgi:hypothetical protein
VNIETWSNDIAALISDALVDASLLKREDMPRANEIIAEEIWIRLQLGDTPPETEA